MHEQTTTLPSFEFKTPNGQTRFVHYTALKAYGSLVRAAAKAKNASTFTILL